MPAPTTTDELLELARKSGVVEDSLLSAALQRLPAAEKSGQPGKLADALVREGALTRFQAEQFMLGKSKGFTLGKYKLLERLGVGGMARVFLGEHLGMRRRVAVKVLPSQTAQDEEVLKRFYREARAAAGLDHPNIVRTFDLDQEGKINFLVMEYVDGSPLHDIVHKHGPLDVFRAAHYIRQAALGLQHACEAGLVHRDIKPGNIMVDRKGTVKLLDLGLARIFNESEEVLTRGVLGTPDYVAPEQSKDSHNVDIRADIYSLGCTFYFLLTGAPPFPEGSVAQKLLWHQTRPARPVRAWRPEVPEGMAAVVHKMLLKDPAQRFQTPAEVAAALGPWTQEPVPPPDDDEMPLLSPAVRTGGGSSKNMMTPPTPRPQGGPKPADAEPARPRTASQVDLLATPPRRPGSTPPAAPRRKARAGAESAAVNGHGLSPRLILAGAVLLSLAAGAAIAFFLLRQ